MRAGKHRMHLGVFVFGTGNHQAGWRYEGAFTSHMELPVMQEIDRSKCDLLFICYAHKPKNAKQPKWHSLSTSSTACWRWDAQATFASYETTRTRDHAQKQDLDGHTLYL